MARKVKLYPDEALVFEVTPTDALWSVGPGDHVEGSVLNGRLAVRRTSGQWLRSIKEKYVVVYPSEVRPLTPSAQALLDLLPLEYVDEEGRPL